MQNNYARIAALASVSQVTTPQADALRRFAEIPGFNESDSVLCASWAELCQRLILDGLIEYDADEPSLKIKFLSLTSRGEEELEKMKNRA